MFRLSGTLLFLVALVATAVSQSVPRELLEMPTHLALDRPTQQVNSGSTVTYTVTLKNAAGQAVAASNDLKLEVETPSGRKTVLLPAGQSSANFTWEARNSGVAHMTVRSGKLYPASGLVLVAPAPRTALIEHRAPARAITEVPPGRRPIGAVAGSQATAAVRGSAAGPPASPSPPSAAEHASKIQLFVEPLPVYGSAVNRIWKANVSVAALGAQNSLAPVPSDVPVHFNATSGRLSPPDIVLPAGQLSNFDHPVALTADHSGKGMVNAVSSLGPAGPVEIEYLQPPPAQLRLSLSKPVLAGTGSSTTTVQVCLLDESGALTSSNEDIAVTLSPPIQPNSPPLTIRHGSACSEVATWTSAPGTITIRAEAGGGLKSDTKDIRFPSFPWYFVWLAAIGGVLGALVFSSGGLFSARWWSHTWRGLVLGAILGAIFYLFARFGAIALPSNSPVNIQNIPVVSGVGSFLLGFVGGLYGRKLWKVDEEKAARPKPPAARKAAGGSGGRE